MMPARRACLLLIALVLTLTMFLPPQAPLCAADADSSAKLQDTPSLPPKPRLPQANFSATVEVTDLSEASRVAQLTKKGLPAGSTKRPIMQRITIRRLGGKTLYQIRWQTGVTTQLWQDDLTGMRVEEAPNGSVYIPRGEGSLMPELASLTPSSISWIHPEQDQKEQGSQNGRDCTRYEREVTLGKSMKVTYQAWIDRKTGLPIMLNDGTAVYKIEFDEHPPTGELTIPAKFQQEIDRIVRELKMPSYL